MYKNLNLSTLTKLISGCLLVTNVAFAGRCCCCGEEYDGQDGKVCLRCRFPYGIIHCGQEFFGIQGMDWFCEKCRKGKQEGLIKCEKCGEKFYGWVGLEKECTSCHPRPQYYSSCGY